MSDKDKKREIPNKPARPQPPKPNPSFPGKKDLPRKKKPSS